LFGVFSGRKRENDLTWASYLPLAEDLEIWTTKFGGVVLRGVEKTPLFLHLIDHRL
jgi:hypothetical protein